MGGNIGATAISTTVQYFRLFGRHSDTTETAELTGLSRAGTASNLYVYIGVAIAAGHTVTLTLRRCAAGGLTCVDTPVTCALINATGTGAIPCDITHTQAYNAGDAMDLKTVDSAGSDSGFGGWSLVY